MIATQFTSNKFKALKTAYETAIKEQADTFIFEGKEYLVTYAKYLIEYLETKLKYPTT